MARPRIVVVGGGFAGVDCLYHLERMISADEADLSLVSPTDYQLYLPLLPHVASGLLTPLSVAVSLRRRLRRTRLVPGFAVGVDTAAKSITVRTLGGDLQEMRYDYVVLAAGSTTRTFDIPGLTKHALAIKTLAQAAYLRDHVISQLDQAAASDDPAERAALMRFVVVGGGYAGTETAAHLQRLTVAAARRFPRLDPAMLDWHLIDIAPALLPEIGPHLGRKATQELTGRGVSVSLGTSLRNLTRTEVTLTDGRVLPTRTVVWTAGVVASPLVSTFDARTVRGRLATTPHLDVPGHAGVFAGGDAAAVPDLDVGGDAITPPTAQHAQRQGKTLARNLAACLRGRPMTPYRHRDLGFVVDLGGIDAVSKPLGIELSGLPAQVVARGYHVFALPTVTARARVLANWVLNTATGDDFVRTGIHQGRPATLQEFELADLYNQHTHQEVGVG
jgi:NADH:ubiquinone reductase (H+-translocating)